MAKTFYVNCPFCAGMMEINAETGEIIQKWSAQNTADAGGDKMSSALRKLEEAKKKRVDLFDVKKDELEAQKRKSEAAFKKEVERAKKEGVKENPIRPFDLD